MSRIDYYSLFQVAPNAEEGVIKAAYKELARKHHEGPLMVKLNEAKEVLLNETKRAEYDDERTGTGRGKRIGNYILKKEIASGGFGRTYLAEHAILGTPVCLKHAHKRKGGISAEDEQLLLEEAKGMWDLRHFGIPSIRDIFKLDDGSFAIVMSYIDGYTLAEFVDKHGSIDPEHVAWITQRVLNVLKYLHFHSVVHGDIKPQNIIVQPERHAVVVVDYGLSAIRPKRNDTNKGYTPFFASPEQVRGNVLIPESDFFSLGMTMIYALGGNIETKEVPDQTPDAMCRFIRNLITYDVLSRPNWQKEDLVETFQHARERDFGRSSSGMKELIY